MTEPDYDLSLAETQHFGLTRIGSNEVFSKNGWAFSDGDVVTVDGVLHALVGHHHNGIPALGDPTDPPTLAVIATGGQLPAATPFYYRCAFIDSHGLETASSPEVSANTPDPIAAPTAPAATVESASGVLTPGVYAYMVTYTDAYGGETTPSPTNDVQVTAGTTNRIRLDLADLIAGAVGVNVYRAKPGQTQFFRVGSTLTDSWYDEGALEDQSILAPTLNTTNSGNSIEVTIPLGFVPEGCTAWTIYRASASGGYDGNSLVHRVSGGATDLDPTPALTWVDTGDVLLQGFPRNTSSTIASAPVIQLGDIQGRLSLTAIPRGSQSLATFAPGVLTDGAVLNATEAIGAIRPTRLTAFFKTPPDIGTSVRIRVEDHLAGFVEMVCASGAELAGDPAGYFHVAFPVTDGGEFQAEDGDRSDVAVVEIVTDLAAVSGQAVALDGLDEWVQVSLGILDAGDYSSSASVRVLVYAAASVNDLVIQAVRTDTDAVLAAISYTPTVGVAYTDYAGPDFTAPGAQPVAIRVRKGTATLQSYNVDSMRADVSVPELAAGTVTVNCHLDDGATVAADANLIMWF